jgi:glucose/arabinose dehydrogenase
MKSCNYIKMILIIFTFFPVSFAYLYAQPLSNFQDITVKSLGKVPADCVRIKRDPVSGNLYILEYNGNISRVNFGSGNSITLSLVYQTSDHGLSAPLGMAFGKDGTMYLAGNEVSDTNGSYATCKIVKGIPDQPGSENRTWSVIAQSVEYTFGHVYNHRTNAIIVDTSGKYIYVNNGACTDHGEMREGHREVGLTSVILKLPVDGNNILLQNDRAWLESHGYVYAEGVRNTFDFAYNANDDLIGVENSGDRDDPDEMNWLQEGHHYGFPWNMGGDVTPQQFPGYDPHNDPLLSPNAWGGGPGMLYKTFYDDSTYPSPPQGVTFTMPIKNYGPDADKFRDTTTGKLEDASDLGVSITTFTPHSSPDGIVFDKDSILAVDLKGGAFVDRINTITALGDPGDDLLHISLTKANGNYTARVTQIVQNFNSPLGIELAGNKLYVLETGLFYANNSPNLYEVTLPEDTVTSVSNEKYLVNKFQLYQNYPNPFNPTTAISYQLSAVSFVSLKVYNILGREVQTLVNEQQSAGNHSETINAGNLASGFYFYKLSAVTSAANQSGRAGSAAFTATKKLLLMK